ncbi:glycoside hydrolase family 25 protein [Streptomyces sp. NPDC001982]|uniref:glycoside hydrolase family 25 protein n=1 Tax=Streptomyces sp. NPDC001982 TaxID=3154405 RepID=UPI00331FA41F
MATCRGVDVSAYQPVQDWASHRRAGVVFAWAKASEGQHSRDPRFATHISGIIAGGLIPGSYHFAWPNQDVGAEAANYVGSVRQYAHAHDYVHWLDLERYSDGRNYAGRTAAQIKAWVNDWIALVEDAFPGQRVGVYTSGDDIAKGHVPAGVPLWYPAYPGSRVDTYAEAETAAQPRPSGRQPLIWQFTSTPASGPRMDLNICYLSAAGLRAWAAGDEETDMPLTADDINKVADAVVKKLTASGVLESSDVQTIWSADVLPAARPPYNNGDYFKDDGKTPGNTTWAAGYMQLTQVEGIRETLARVEAIQKALATLNLAELEAALVAKLDGLKVEVTVTNPQGS